MGRRLVYSERNAPLCDDDVLLLKFNTSFKSYLDCIGLKDIKPILVNGTKPDNGIQNFCGKTPKICSKTILADMPACPKYIDSTNDLINTVEKVKDYFCSDSGSAIKIFLKEGGPNCIKNKKNETLICVLNAKQDPGTNINQITEVNIEKVMNCVIQKLKTCNKPKLTKIVETVAGIVHDGYFHPTTPTTVNNSNAASEITLTSGIVLVTSIKLFI